MVLSITNEIYSVEIHQYEDDYFFACLYNKKSGKYINYKLDQLSELMYFLSVIFKEDKSKLLKEDIKESNNNNNYDHLIIKNLKNVEIYRTNSSFYIKSKRVFWDEVDKIVDKYPIFSITTSRKFDYNFLYYGGKSIDLLIYKDNDDYYLAYIQIEQKYYYYTLDQFPELLKFLKILFKND